MGSGGADSCVKSFNGSGFSESLDFSVGFSSSFSAVVVEICLIQVAAARVLPGVTSTWKIVVTNVPETGISNSTATLGMGSLFFVVSTEVFSMTCALLGIGSVTRSTALPPLGSQSPREFLLM